MRRAWTRVIVVSAATAVIVPMAPVAPAYAAQDQAATSVLGSTHRR